VDDLQPVLPAALDRTRGPFGGLEEVAGVQAQQVEDAPVISPPSSPAGRITTTGAGAMGSKPSARYSASNTQIAAGFPAT